MATLLAEANSVLGIDIGSIHTRAILFDVVEESYHFLASAFANSTYGEPFFDIGEGVFEAINQLQEVTGRVFLDHDGNLIIPSHSGLEGVDRLLLTVSCGSDLNLVTFGLLNDVSLETANRLAKTTFANINESFGINDRRPMHAQMDALLAARPDILIVAGGTDRGATRSVARQVNMIATSLQLIPKEMRPKVLFCGNQAMNKRVKETLEKVTEVHFTNNIRPTIDSEDLEKATVDLGKLVMDHRMQNLIGLDRMSPLCSDHPILTSTGFQRVIQFLGKQYDPAKGVLGLDLGSARTIAAYANNVESSLNVFQIGMGKGLEKMLVKPQIEEIRKWMPEQISYEELSTYLWQKTLYPESIPVTDLDLSIELALTRQVLRMTMRELISRGAFTVRNFEPIIVSGLMLTHAASPQQILLTLLDGLQPVGITPLVLDKHGIIPLLGASAKINPLLPVQVLESTAFINLATIVTVESATHHGNTILQARLQNASGKNFDAEVKQGSIISMPLKSGETGQLFLKPIRRTRIEDVEITSEPIKIKGGVCGVVIDAWSAIEIAHRGYN